MYYGAYKGLKDLKYNLKNDTPEIYCVYFSMKRVVLSVHDEQCWTMIIAGKSGVQAQFLAYIYMAYIFCSKRQSIKYKVTQLVIQKVHFKVIKS
jgi:hypothetical protein